MTTAARTLLAVNAGSSSVKLALFDADTGALLARERFEGIGDARRREEVLAGIGEWAGRRGAGASLAAASHRVVHGGAAYAAPVVVTAEVLRDLDDLAALAPLHQAPSLAPIRALRKAFPSLVQVACFDTAFHRGRASAVERYALPAALFEQGIRRYGFHGLSYEYVAGRLREISPHAAQGRTIVAHLGSGASLCAMRDGRSVDTTMGFSTLDGLVMGTRCGSLDPGVVLHLLRDGRRSVAEVERLLYHESGLLGLSGISADVRDLLASEDAAAREALDCFVLAIARAAGALTSTLGGLDAFVFTAGIGEHSAEIRARVAAALAWTGLELDGAANAAGAVRLSTPASRVSAWRIETDEEAMLAAHATRLLGTPSTR
jgi:acetate kinase